MHNFTYIHENLMSWSLQGYVTVLGYLFWPLFFSVIIVYIYLKNQSLTVMSVSILIIVSIFGEFIANVSPFYNLLFISVTLIFTVIILMFFLRRRVG